MMEQLLEYFGVLTGLLYLFLEIRQHRAMWVVGFLTSLVYVFVFFFSKIYADMGLNIYYVAISIYGFWQWTRSKGRQEQTADSSSGSNPLPQYDTPSFCRDQLFHRCPVCVTLLCPALFHRFADTGRRCFYHRRRNRRHLDAGTPDRRALDLLDRRQLRVRLSLLPAWALSHNVSLYLLRHTGGSRIIHLEKERNKNK